MAGFKEQSGDGLFLFLCKKIGINKNSVLDAYY